MRLIFGRVLPEQLPRPIDLRHFTGRLAEIAVYDRTLSADEVRRHAAPARR
jgi:hypothetical protein